MTNAKTSIRIYLWLILALIAGAIAASLTDHKPIDPNVPETFQPTAEMIRQHNAGIALMGQFDYAGAHDAFQRLVDGNPDWTELKVDLAIATLNRRQGDDSKNAAELLEGVITEHPLHWRAIYCRGLLHLNAGEPEAALKRFQQVADAHPDDGYAIYYTGKCLFDLGEHEKAMEYFLRAQKADPYLRSTYYGAFQAKQRQGDLEGARGYLEQFQKLETNPQARLAEIKYTRMGPNAEVKAHDPVERTARKAMPAGELFAESAPVDIQGADDVAWRSFTARDPSTVSICDIDGDGRLDLFVAQAFAGAGGLHNAVLLQNEDRSFRLAKDHSLAAPSNINAALWGDFDNDSMTDAYFCRAGTNQLWQRTKDGWQDVTDTSQTSGGEFNTVEGAFFDMDHDGDLDLMLVNRDGPNELLNNNLDGTFRPLAADRGIQGSGGASSGAVLVDFDSDRDADLIVINEEAPNEVYANDRLWDYSVADSLKEIVEAPIQALVATDINTDGNYEYVLAKRDGPVLWQYHDGRTGKATQSKITVPDLIASGAQTQFLAAHDLNGDGTTEIIFQNEIGWTAVSLDEKTPVFAVENGEIGPITLAALDVAGGYAMVAAHSAGPPVLWAPGPARFPFTQFVFTGKESKADQMRTNASGIGVRADVRVGDRWTTVGTFGESFAPGQNLQPTPIGLLGQQKMDFVSIRWPDGLFQSEIGLVAGETHAIEEVQRQVSSCPVLFVWNGTEYEFVTDVLGVGGVGFNVADGEYGPPRPWENLLLPTRRLKQLNGQYRIKLGEPMEEAMYIDSTRLVAYDLPKGWQMTLDERFATAAPDVTGATIFYPRLA